MNAQNTNLAINLLIKELEETGIVVNEPVPKVVKAGLYCLVGDNLGAHSINEMSENFRLVKFVGGAVLGIKKLARKATVMKDVENIILKN